MKQGSVKKMEKNIDKAGEANLKINRVLDYLEKNQYEAAVLGRQDNFSWVSCGGTNKILNTSEFGSCLLLLSRDERIVIAYSMDGQRIIDEELCGLGFELVELKWYECDLYKKTSGLLKNRKAISDVLIEGADFILPDIYNLHYPLTGGDAKKIKWLAEKAEIIICEASKKIKPGMSERDAERILKKESAENDIDLPVCLIGSDEKIPMYRHPLPTEKKIKNIILLAPAFRKWGIFAPVSRMIYFGKMLEEKIKTKYDAVCTIEASVFSMCKPGTKFSDILIKQKSLYAQLGFPQEWKNHFQGGITGYFPNDPSKCLDKDAKILKNQTFNWYITITGVKVEEVFSSTGGLLSSRGLWPVKNYEVEGESFYLPQIMIV